MDTYESWRDIPGYTGLYQASNQGRIRTHPNKITSNAKCNVRRWKPRIMKGRGDNCGTGKRVGLWKDGEVKDYLFARIIGMVWVQGYSPDLTINHINGNRLDNRKENLRESNRVEQCRNRLYVPNKQTGEIGIYIDHTKGLKKKYATKVNCKSYRFHTLEEAKAFRKEQKCDEGKRTN